MRFTKLSLNAFCETTPFIGRFIQLSVQTFLVGLGRIPDIRLIFNAGYLANVLYPANYRISVQITGYPALEISWISGIRIVSISGILPDIENGLISGYTGYPSKPDIRPNPSSQIPEIDYCLIRVLYTEGVILCFIIGDVHQFIGYCLIPLDSSILPRQNSNKITKPLTTNKYFYHFKA